MKELNQQRPRGCGSPALCAAVPERPPRTETQLQIQWLFFHLAFLPHFFFFLKKESEFIYEQESLPEPIEAAGAIRRSGLEGFQPPSVHS